MKARRLLFLAGLLLVGTAGVLAARFVTQRLGAPLPAPAVLDEASDATRTVPRVDAPALAVAAEPSTTREASAPPADERPAEPAAPGVLRVRVLSQATADPIAGIHLWLEPDEGEAEPEPEITDDRGVVELAAAAGESLRLRVDGSWVGMSTVADELEALDPGERREHTVRLAGATGLRYFGRVVDARSGALVEGATVELLLGSRPGDREAAWPPDGVLARTTSGADGLYSLHVAAPGRDVARVTRPGHGPAYLQLAGGHEEAVRAEELPLERAGSLAATVWDEGRPVAGVELSVRASVRDLLATGESLYFLEPLREREEVWTATTDVEGTASLDDLPPGVPLTVEVTRADGAEPGGVLARERRELEPGGLEVLELSLGEGALIRGRAPLANGAPVEGLELWLAPVAGQKKRHRFQPGERITARTETDAEGRFSFPAVPEGEWWVGPAPPEDDLQPALRAAAFAPEASRLVVGPPGSVQDVTLEVHRGLYVTGRVVGPDGLPAAGARVGELSIQSWTTTDPEGRFAYGPLSPDSLRLVARLPDDPFVAESEPTRTEAGATDLLLRLRAGGRISGRLVDAATGQPIAGQVRLVAPDHMAAGFLVLYRETDADGYFTQGGLLPTGYHVVGVEAGLRVGWLAPRALHAGEDWSGLRVPLAPAARLHLRLEVPEGAPPAVTQVEVRQDGLVLDLAIVSSASSTLVTVPTGPLELVPVGREPLREETLEVVLAAGQSGEAVFHTR